MEDSTAEGLAGGGARLAVASLAAPWYSVGVSSSVAARLPGDLPALGSQSGWAALGHLHWAVLVLAVLAGWRGAIARPGLPALAAFGLLLIAGFAWVAPPDAANALLGQLPQNADPITTSFAQGVVTSLADQIGLEMHAAVGLALAGAGAGAALYGSLNLDPPIPAAPSHPPFIGGSRFNRTA